MQSLSMKCGARSYAAVDECLVSWMSFVGVQLDSLLDVFLNVFLDVLLNALRGVLLNVFDLIMTSSKISINNEKLPL